MKRILVGLDGSSRAPVVLAGAANLARASDAKLVLFRAVGLPLDLPKDFLVLPEARLEDKLRAVAHADLDRLAATVSDVPIERIIVEIGTPWDSIVRKARDIDADLIVIGSHGYSGLDRLLGTTAGKVVNHADRNVMVVRTPL